MIKNFWLVLTLAWLLACSYTLEVQASAGYKDYNKAVFDALNKARKSPSTYKAYAEKEQKSFVYDSAGAITRSLCKDSTFTEKSTTCSKKEETNMGQSRWIDAVAFLGSQLPKPELKWDESLSQACYDHIQAQGPTGDVGNSANGQVLQVRADSYVMGMNYGMAYAYMDVSYPEDPILRAIIGDRGDDFRGGRQGIFSDSVTRAGVSWGCHKLYGEMCCILTANVMEDKNPSLVAKSAPQLSTCAAYTETTTDTTGAIFTLNSIDGTSTDIWKKIWWIFLTY